MNKHKKLQNLFAAAALLFSTLVMASAEQDFNRAMQQFRAGDFAAAVAGFESARKQGMKSVSLYYNLGSAYYRLGDFWKAKSYFEQVKQYPRMQDLADYNLGLIAEKTANKKIARQYFSSVVAISKDKKLIAMASSKIARLDSELKPWSAYIAANYGYDDNITASPSGAVLDLSDNFYDLFMSVDTVVSGSKKHGWLVDASYFTIDFSDTDLYDDSQYSVGISRTAQLSDWELKTHVSFNNRDYGDEDFQTVTKLDVKGKKPLSKSERLYLRYIYEDISSDNVLYDYLQGWRQRVRIEYTDYQKKNISQLYYELELNDREDIDTLTYVASYSPTRHGIRGKYTYILDSKWFLTADLSYRISDYPVTISQDRRDDRWRFAIDADYRIDKTTRLRTKLQFISNESTVDVYDYDKSVFTVGVSKLF